MSVAVNMTNGKKVERGINSYMKRFILVLGLLIGIVSVDAAPGKKGPRKDRGGKPTPEQIEERKKKFEAAKKKRDSKRTEDKKKGYKHKGPRGRFGKLIQNDEKIKELKKDFAEASKKIKGKFDRKQWKDATDDEKAALRDKIKTSRKDWESAMKEHRKEVGARIKEIREEFKNKRDAVIDGNKPGE